MLLANKKLQAFGLALTVGLAACSDTNGPGDGEFDAPATTAELTAVDGTFETPAYQSLAALGQYFENGPVAMASASAALLEAQQQNASASMSDRAIQNAPQLSANMSAFAPIPRLEEYYGTQFVYVAVLERWELYAIDPETTDLDRERMGIPPLEVLLARARELNESETLRVLGSDRK